MAMPRWCAVLGAVCTAAGLLVGAGTAMHGPYGTVWTVAAGGLVGLALAVVAGAAALAGGAVASERMRARLDAARRPALALVAGGGAGLVVGLVGLARATPFGIVPGGSFRELLVGRAVSLSASLSVATSGLAPSLRAVGVLVAVGLGAGLVVGATWLGVREGIR